MRNGNTAIVLGVIASLFGSYRTYEEWKLTFTSVVRRSMLSSYRTYEEWKPTDYNRKRDTFRVLTVPMRNGNLTCKAYPSAVRNSSYRTYEEWKPPDNFVSIPDNFGSYRTYEEWKQHLEKLISNVKSKFLPYL